MRALCAPGLLSLLIWIALAARSRESTHVPLWLFLGSMAGAWACLWWAWMAARSGAGRSVSAIWLWALLFRGAGLWGDPVLEDDHFRYLWDGWTYAQTGDPYASRPSDFFDSPAVPERFQEILDRVNHPDVPTVYGPVCEAAFLASFRIAPGELWPWKLMVTAADLLTGLILARTLAPANLLVYLWCPLLIKETAFTAHPDSLGILFLVAALALLARRPAWAGISVALAAGVKITGALLLPWVLWKGGWRAWAGFAGAAAVLATQFQAGGLWAFAAGWEFNSSLFALAAAAMGPAAARVICGLAFAAYYAWVFRRRPEGADAPGEWLYGGLFLLSPVVNPWYVLWLLPFVAARPRLVGLAALAAAALSYICGLSLDDPALGPYDHPVWVRWAEYGAVAYPILWTSLKPHRAIADRETSQENQTQWGHTVT